MTPTHRPLPVIPRSSGPSPQIRVDRVTLALDPPDARLTLNHLADATGLSMSQLCITVQAMERDGHLRFAAGRWTLASPTPASPHQIVAPPA